MSEEFTNFEEIQLDNSETAAWDGEARPLLPVGPYLLTVVGMKQQPAGASGAPYIEVEFVVSEGEYVNQKVWNNYSLSNKALGRLKSLQLACRTQLDKIVAAQFIGVTIRAEIIHQDGAAKIDSNGNPMPAKTFANVTKEQALDEVEPEKPVAAAKPPVMNKPTTQATKPAATNNTAARRA